MPWRRGARSGDILRACPNLETLNYEAGGAAIGFEQFTPCEARDMIFQYAPGLRTVSLDMRSADWFDDAKHGMALRGIDFAYVS